MASVLILANEIRREVFWEVLGKGLSVLKKKKQGGDIVENGFLLLNVIATAITPKTSAITLQPWRENPEGKT